MGDILRGMWKDNTQPELSELVVHPNLTPGGKKWPNQNAAFCHTVVQIKATSVVNYEALTVVIY